VYELIFSDWLAPGFLAAMASYGGPRERKPPSKSQGRGGVEPEAGVSAGASSQV